MSRRSRITSPAAAALLLLACSACDSGDGGGPSCPPPLASPPTTGTDFEATAVGATSVYRVTETNRAVSTLTLSVTAHPTGTTFTRRSRTGGDATYQEDTLDVAGGGERLVSRSSFRGDGSLAWTTTSSPSEVILPADVTSGATASSDSTVTWTGVANSPYTTTRAVTVGQMECVIVPAGAFQALRVTTVVATSTTPGSSTTNVAWWAVGVGRVRIENYPTGSPSLVSTMELLSY